MKYQPEFDPGYLDPVDGIHNSTENANKSYVNGDPRIGRKGSIPPAQVFEHPQREIMAVIEGAGLSPSHTNLAQLWQALQVIQASNASGNGAVAVYEAFAAAKHRFRDLIPGDNISLQLVETSAGSGRYGIKINVSNVSGSGSGSQNNASGGGAGDVIRPCLVGITGDLTNLASCGNAIASGYYTTGYEAAKAFDDNTATKWQGANGAGATASWIGWDFDPSNAGYFGTINKATLRQYHNLTNRTDKWRAAVLQATNDPSRSTWTTIATWASLSDVPDDAMGPVEAITFANYSARAFRIVPTSVYRYSGAGVPVPNITEVEFIKL